MARSALFAALVMWVLPTGGAPSLLGEWRGTSTCTNLELVPGCHDEVIRYRFEAPTPGAKLVHLKADKLVNGSFELMYELDLAASEPPGAWTAALTAPRMNGKWSYRIDNGALVGSLTLAPSNAEVRKVAATRPGVDAGAR